MIFKMRKGLKCSLAIIFVLHSFNTIGQYKNNFATPNATSLGMYGEIPIDYFSGLPDINLPLYDFKSKDLTIPISLAYHASNIRPSDHSSWVGLGWTLQCGGVITRIINDLPDEFILYDYVGTGANLGREKKGFFFNYGLLGNNNWTGSTMIEEANSLFQSGIADYSWYVDHVLYRADKAPDEFEFNFLGMSGSMFMGQDGQWQFKTKQGIYFKVSFAMGNYRVIEPTSFPHIPAGSLIKNCITKFILTGSDGTQYTFGNTSTSIEFIRNGIGQPTSGSRDGGTIPSSWYLTKIKSSSGDEINLDYSRDGYQIINNPGGIGYMYNCATCTPANNLVTGSGVTQGDQLVILDGVSLSSISSVNGSVNFNKEKAKILDFSINDIYTIPTYTSQMFEAYGYEVFNGTMSNVPYSILTASSTFMQLNNIIINSNNNVVKSFAFSYNTGNNSTPINNRLFLNSLIGRKSNGEDALAYNFTYNNINGLAGVPYETNKIDNWGYYTGINPLNGLIYNTTFQQPFFNSTFRNTYTSQRSTVESAMGYAILTNIKYPTGGNSEFIWEPNTYSKYIDQTPVNNVPNINVVNAGNTFIGAGLRIKKINSKADLNSPILSKSYFYYRDYITHTDFNSTGVLNSSLPNYFSTYWSSGNFYYEVWSNNNRAPLHYTNGAIITYSKVQEVNSDGSFVEYNYSNHDNGYLDKIPTKAFFSDYGNSALQEFRTNSLDLERGVLLEKTDYNPNFVKVNKVVNQYNDDPNRFNFNVRSYLFENKFTLDGSIVDFQRHVAIPGGTAFLGANLYALNTFTYYPFLKGQTNFQYDQNGSNLIITNKAYTYDTYRNLKSETTTSSKGEIIATNNNYPTDNVLVSPYNEMVSRNIISPIIEKKQTNITLNKELSKTKVEYQFWQNNTLIQPLRTQQSKAGNLLETETTFNAYDDKGNLLEVIGRDNITTSYFWGYNQQYPVAKVIGKSYNDAFSQSAINLSILNNPNTTDADMRNELNKIRQLTNCYVTTYTYKPLVGISSETDPNGKSIYYEYDKLGRLMYVRDNDNNIIKSYDYNYKN